MTEDQKKICKAINENAVLQSVLYDLNLLPEQTMDTDRWFYTVSVLDHIMLLIGERDALKVDADRYRHLRASAQPQNRNGPGLYWYLPRWGNGSWGEQLDASIDASMAEKQKAKP